MRLQRALLVAAVAIGGLIAVAMAASTRRDPPASLRYADGCANAAPAAFSRSRYGADHELQGYRRLVPSALVSGPGTGFYAFTDASSRCYVIGYIDDHVFKPTAFIDRDADRQHFHLALPAGQEQRKQPLLRTTSLEYLYGVILSLDTLSTFSVSTCNPQRQCGPTSQDPTSQAGLLSFIAGERNKERSKLPDNLARQLRAWYVITLTARSLDADHVLAELQVGRQTDDWIRALEGSTVSFSRRPHSGCSAPVVDGRRASCALEDSHGDDHEHEDEAVPTIATYSGKVLRDGVFLPTTAVIASRR